MRRAIVTGAAAGLGADMAEALVAAGYHVGIMDISKQQTEETAAHIVAVDDDRGLVE